MKEPSEFLANGIDKTVKLLSSAPSFPQGLLQEALIKNAEKSVGSYWWSENTTSLIYMDSSTTSRQSPVLKLNLYLPLLPFPAPDTAKQCQEPKLWGIEQGCWLNVQEQPVHK